MKTGLSVKPLFWSLFAAGGMVAAIIAPVLILLFGLLLPFGIITSAASFYQAFSPLAKHWLLLLMLAGTLFLMLWHCCHRFYYFLHDLKFHLDIKKTIAIYGIAVTGFLLTIIFAW